MNKNPFSNVGFSTSQKRHNLIVCATLVLGVLGLILSSLWIVWRDLDSKAAVDLVESGLVLLSKDKIDEGLAKLELAEAQSKGVCNLRTDNNISENETDLRDFSADKKLARLRGIRHLRRDEDWVDDEIMKILTEQKRCDEAQELYRKRLKPWNDYNRTILSTSDEAPVEVKIAQMLWDQGKKAEAAKQLERPATLFPWNNITRELAMKVFKDQKLDDKLKDLDRTALSDEKVKVLQETTFDTGSDSKRLNEYISKVDSVIREHPKCAIALLLRSDHQLQLKHHDKAINDASSVVAMYPWLAEGYYARGKVYLDQGKDNECMRDYASALKLMPDCEMLLQARISAATVFQDYDQILRDRSTLVALEPYDVERLEDKSNYLLFLERAKEAEQVIDAAIPLDVNAKRIDRLVKPDRQVTDVTTPSLSNSRTLKQQKAYLRMRQGNPKGGLELIDTLIQEKKDDISNYDLQADLLLSSGDKKGALAAASHAIELQGEPFFRHEQYEQEPTFLTGKVTKLPDQLPPGSTVKPLLLERMEKRAKIYCALGDHDAERKEFRDRLKLMKLELGASGGSSRCFDVIGCAIMMDDIPTALFAANQYWKDNQTVNNWLYMEDECERLTDWGHHQTALAVLKEFNKHYPGRKRIEAAIAKVNAQTEAARKNPQSASKSSEHHGEPAP